jgi:hypothetical protein
MDTILNRITSSTSLLTGSSKSATQVLDMSQYDRAVIRAHVCKASVSVIATTVSATVSVYQCATQTNTGVSTLLAQEVVDVNGAVMGNTAEIEVSAPEMSDTSRYIYGHVAISTVTESVLTSLIVERGDSRYNAQND